LRRFEHKEETIAMASSVSFLGPIGRQANGARIIIRKLTVLLALACMWGCVNVGTPAENIRASSIETRLKSAMAEYCAQEAAFEARATDGSSTDAISARGREAGRSFEVGFSANTIQAPDASPASAVPVPSTSVQHGPTPQPTACPAAIELSNQPFMHASTDGKRVRISRDMLHFAADDSELAFVMGHELAHVLLHHSPMADNSKRRRYALEADYVGIYIVARARYDVVIASHFIERLAQSTPGFDVGHPDYPSSSERYAMLHRAVIEIEHKSEARLTLAPSLKAGDGSSFGFIPRLP
jgi:hypothetical protein